MVLLVLVLLVFLLQIRRSDVTTCHLTSRIPYSNPCNRHGFTTHDQNTRTAVHGSCLSFPTSESPLAAVDPSSGKKRKKPCVFSVPYLVSTISGIEVCSTKVHVMHEVGTERRLLWSS